MLWLLILIPLSFTIPTIFAYQLFERAGKNGFITLIPFYNLYVWLQIVKKPLWWYIFLLIPFINVFVYMLMIVEMLKCYGKFSLIDQALAVLFPFLYFPYLSFYANAEYTHPDEREKRKKTWIREWVDAIIFAVIAASIIRIFLFEAYTIPTSSMEKSLLIGDFLFVSKIAYGPRPPMTPIAFPFVHHTMPLSQTAKSYVEWLKLPYYRFPGLSEIKRNDAVVFNYPDGDTLSLKFQSNVSYYAMTREFGYKRVNSDFRNFGEITARPVDKRENYIKRCIGMPGDTLQIIDQQVYINGEAAENPGILQFKYLLKTDGSSINPRALERLDISEKYDRVGPDTYRITLSEEAADRIKTFPYVRSLEKIVDSVGNWRPDVFPYDANFKWNIDNYGPIVIPKEGETVTLTPENIALYKRVIHAYELNDLEIKDGKIYINGKEASEYTFKMNYYWMMGDNRHNSADSRIWGYVPEDHIVGKAVFVWLSLDQNKSLMEGKIRWNKMFRIVK